MRKIIFKNIILLTTTIIMFFVLLETGMRIIAFFSPQFLCETFSDPSDSILCQLEPRLSESIKNYNQTTGVNNQNICDKWDSELGWIPKPNCRTPVYSTNSKGFRGTQEYFLEKDKKIKTRIIVLGDSFTWGENNFDNETYPFYLSKLYNENVDVINMGVHGYGPDQFYLYYIREGVKYKPDIVVFGLFLPDIHRTIFRMRDYFKPRFIIINGDLMLDKDSSYIPDIPIALKMSSEIKKKSRSYAFSYFYELFSKAQRRYTSYKYEASLTLKIIDELNKQLKEHKTRLIVLLIPEQEMIEKNNDDYYGAIPQITEHLEKENIEYINLQSLLKKEYQATGQSLYMGHLKPIRNIFVAQELFKYLNNN